MIYSRSAEHAIRALVHLAGLGPGRQVLAKTLAADAKIPAPYLSRILQDLARAGFLKSTKGPGGGFRFIGPTEEITLLRIVEAVDGAGVYEKCPYGEPECTPRALCGMHGSWNAARSGIIEYLATTSIASLAKALSEKRRVIARARKRSEQRTAGSHA